MKFVCLIFRYDCSPCHPAQVHSIQVFVCPMSLPHPLNLTTLTSKRRCVAPSPCCHGRATLREAAAAPGRCEATWEERSVHSTLSGQREGSVSWCKESSRLWGRKGGVECVVWGLRQKTVQFVFCSKDQEISIAWKKVNEKENYWLKSNGIN